MPTRKIAELPEIQSCNDPEHFPPTMAVFPPGVYEHECPTCGHKTQFVVGPRPVINPTVNKKEDKGSLYTRCPHKNDTIIRY